jgi:SAM-dependent methyltransferase
MARRHHGEQGTFLLGDARALAAVRGLKAASFDAVIFLLSLQDMDPLGDALAGAAWALRPRGRAVLLLTHPAFRVPRQSGWGWDEGRKLLFRRIDRYLTPLAVPMKSLPGRQTSAPTRSFHRPIQDYVNGLAAHGMLVERMEEIPGHKLTRNPDHPRAEEMARREIPLFLGLRARKLSP